MADDPRLIDLAMLRAGLERLAGIVPAAHRSRLDELLRQGSDAALFRVNPLALARDWSIEEDEGIDLMLHATGAGLFGMVWQLLCPICGEVVRSHGGPGALDAHYRCDLCQADFETTLDKYVEVAFTVSPQVRPIGHHHPLRLTVEDFYYQCEFHPGARFPGGGRLVDWLRDHSRLLAYLDPGETREVVVDLGEGYLEGCDRIHHQGFLFRIVAGRAQGPQSLHLALGPEGFSPREGELSSGPLRLSCANHAPSRAAVIAIHFPEAELMTELPRFDPHLTGRRLVTSLTYRTLFGGAALKDDGSLKIKEVAVMFTDVVGSVGLFEQLGDVRAYGLLREHYGIAARLAGGNGGTIVKVIGDAVMMAFDGMIGALHAALAMMAEAHGLGKASGLPGIGLRVGIHWGASILVGIDGRMDFFGQAVNVAARVQEVASGGEICLSAEAASAPGMDELLAKLHVERIQVELPGLAGMRDIVRLRAGPAG